MIKRLIRKFKIWNDKRKFKKFAKKFGAVRYMDTASMYPDMKLSITIPLNDCIYADTDSLKKGECQ